MSEPRPSSRYSIASELGIALVTLALIGLALGAHRPMLVPILFVSVAAVVLVVRKCLPNALFVTTTLAIGIPIYVCVYALLAIRVFEGEHAFLAYAGCLLPLIGFAFAVWRHRSSLNHQLEHRRVDARLLARGIGWVALAASMISISGEIASTGDGSHGHGGPLLAGMAAVAIIVYLAIEDLIVLMAVTGHLFRTFIGRMLKRAVPVFSFLLVYCFLVIIFGSLYSILDEVTGRAHFTLNGKLQPLDLADAIYFSMVTMSTIGYGDILAVSSAARTMAVVEILTGVVLILFALAEIASYDPETEQALAGTDPERKDEEKK
jgi:voltage-gated potassium channel